MIPGESVSKSSSNVKGQLLTTHASRSNQLIFRNHISVHQNNNILSGVCVGGSLSIIHLNIFSFFNPTARVSALHHHKMN